MLHSFSKLTNNNYLCFTVDITLTVLLFKPLNSNFDVSTFQILMTASVDDDVETLKIQFKGL